MTDNAPLLQLRGVHRSFQTSEDAPPVEVLRGVDLTVSAGEQLAVVGPSGTGKSTLLHLMGGLDLADEGTVTLMGSDWAALDENARAAHRRQTVGFIFQSNYLLPHLDLLDNVLVPVLAGGKVFDRHYSKRSVGAADT